MKKKMIMWAITMFVERLSSEDMKKWIDMGLDLIEDKVADSESTMDDMIVLPMCKVIREAMSIPDNDDVAEV